MSGKSKVAFRVNLGSRDAESLGLVHAKCTAGSELTVSEDTAMVLVKMGHAVAIEEPEPQRKLKAVSDKPQIADAKAPEITE